jgi:hypothetical protein
MKGPMEPIAVEVWAFDESFRHVLLVRHRWRGWVPPGGKVEAGETPREAARREFRGILPGSQSPPQRLPRMPTPSASGKRMTMSHNQAGKRHRHSSRRFAAGIVAALAASISLMVANTAPAFADNINYPAQEVNDNSNLCMGIAGGSSADGAAVVQFRCVLHPDQAWMLPWLPGSSLNDLRGSTGLV